MEAPFIQDKRQFNLKLSSEMTDTFTIKAGRHLPTIEDLQQLLQSHEVVTFIYRFLPDGYISDLVYSLPFHSVCNREWDKTVIISPSVANEKILQKKRELVECARSFREQANHLMNLMAKAFDINLQTLDGLHDLKYHKSQKQRGLLNKEWSYFLHGAECRFENKATGQTVEIIVITKPEFGYLDCYFFYNYMATTERFKELAAYFDNNYLHVCKAIDLLAHEGVLTRVSDLSIERNVIAL
ncbi:hypothetical protein JMG10_07860 [Nostoc ellipsosporum NOK]|nr:hypothetical protein [Nostoc ellipsosporum NOK]